MDIAQNDIGGNSTGMKVLAGAIKHCGRLYTLMLDHNDIGPEALAGAIKCCSNLHTLDVGCVKVLANPLQHCSCLHTLIIACNDVRKDGSCWSYQVSQ